MKVAQALAGDLSVFETHEAEIRDKELKSLEYIRFLSDSMSVNIDEWDLFKTFGKLDKEELLFNKRDINKRFFEHQETAKNEVTSILTPDLMREIGEAAKSARRRQRRRWREERRTHLRAARDSHNHARREIGHAHRITKLMDGTDSDDNTVKQITEMLSNGKVAFHKDRVSSRNKLEFVTTQPCMLEFKNPAADIDIKVDLGFFRMVLDLEQSSWFAHPYMLNIYSGHVGLMTDGYMHPHAVGDGDICLGDAHNDYVKAMGEGRYNDGLNIVLNVLENYHEGNPYKPLHYWQRIEEGERKGEVIRYFHHSCWKPHENEMKYEALATAHKLKDEVEEFKKQKPGDGPNLSYGVSPTWTIDLDSVTTDQTVSF